MDKLNNSNKQIKLAHWNANGLKFKWNELKDFVLKFKIDIMLINETKTRPGRKYNLQGYNLIRKNRVNTQGGVPLILIKQNIKYSEINALPETKTIESLGLKLSNNPTIFSVYVRLTEGRITNKIDPTELHKIMTSSSRVIALIGDYITPTYNMGLQK